MVAVDIMNFSYEKEMGRGYCDADFDCLQLCCKLGHVDVRENLNVNRVHSCSIAQTLKKFRAMKISDFTGYTVSPENLKLL